MSRWPFESEVALDLGICGFGYHWVTPLEPALIPDRKLGSALQNNNKNHSFRLLYCTKLSLDGANLLTDLADEIAWRKRSRGARSR